MNRAVALYRSPAYSPRQHLTNDRVILDETVERLSELNWDIVSAHESDVVAGHLPVGQLYLNMCQGVAASATLRRLLPRGAVSINLPQAVEACHRHRLVPRLRGAGVPFPWTVLVPTRVSAAVEPTVASIADNGHPVWIKRGDVHAETPEDVVAVSPADVARTLSAFATRGIATAALQAHVPGPVVKFYGVADERLFHWYPADRTCLVLDVDAAQLRDVAARAAKVLGLEVYGGDAVIRGPNDPVLIDLNDWPSFAPVRAAAADAIAQLAHERAETDRILCSTH